MEKNVFTPVFRNWKVQKLSIKSFHSKFVDIIFRDQKFGQKVLKIENF